MIPEGLVGKKNYSPEFHACPGPLSLESLDKSINFLGISFSPSHS